MDFKSRATWRVLRLCGYVLSPIRHVEQAYGMGLLMLQLFGIAGLFAVAAHFLSPSPWWMIFWALAGLLLLSLWAVYQLQQRVEVLEAPPLRPHNWEALIRTANRWQNAASDVASDHYVNQVLRKEDSERVHKPDTKKQQAYDDATREFETEIDIAGGTLARMLLLAFAEARHAITACRYDHSTHDEMKCHEYEEKVNEAAREFTKALSN